MSLGFWEILLIVVACYFLFGQKRGGKVRRQDASPKPGEKVKVSTKFPFGLN